MTNGEIWFRAYLEGRKICNDRVNWPDEHAYGRDTERLETKRRQWSQQFANSALKDYLEQFPSR